MSFKNGYLTEKLKGEIESEVSATIKFVMFELERLAALPPEIACEPVAFNEARRAVIRKIWNLSKVAISYGGQVEQ